MDNRQRFGDSRARETIRVNPDLRVRSHFDKLHEAGGEGIGSSKADRIKNFRDINRVALDGAEIPNIRRIQSDISAYRAVEFEGVRR